MNSTASLASLGPRYKWVALSNTTLGVLIATINSSILLIALPDIFRGLRIDPLVEVRNCMSRHPERGG